MEIKIQELGGEYIAEKIIERSKDTNIIYSTEDIVLNTNCVKQLAEYLENLLSRLKTAESELETYKKIAEKVAGLTESISKGDIKLIDTACKDIKIRECLENEKCINCILEWARKKVEENV